MKGHITNSLVNACLPRFIVFLTIIFALLSGCSLPIFPNSAKEDGVPKPQEQSNEDSRLAKIEKQHAELIMRLSLVEEKVALLRADNKEKQQNISQTINLLELNLIEIKKKQASLINELNERPTAAQPKATKPVTSQKKPRVVSTKKQKPAEGLVGEIETPETSKAIETVSLIPSSAKSNQNASAQAEKSVELTEKTVENPPIAIPNKTKAESFPTNSWEDPDLDPPVSPISLTVVPGAKRFYQNAFKTYSSRNYSDSIVEFKHYIERFPNDQDADNAQYWIGQSQYRLENYLEAEKSYRKVLNNYKHGDTKHGYKTPDSILMLGRIYLIKEKPIKARYYFQQVIMKYPDSISANKARKEIQSMNVF